MKTNKVVIVSCHDISIFSSKGELISGISLDIKKGECIILTGNNGSGKSLLAETIAGKRIPRRGEINYKPGKIVGTKTAINVRATGLLEKPGSFISLISFDGSSFMRKFREMYYQKRFNDDEGFAVPLVSSFIQSEINKTNKVAHISKIIIPDYFFPSHLMVKKVNQLSNGETKRLLIYLALLQDSEMLVLDEPFEGLDTASRLMLTNLLAHLKTQGITLLIISGRESIPLFTDRVLEITNGRLLIAEYSAYIRANEAKLGSVKQVELDETKQIDLDAAKKAEFGEKPSIVKMENVNISYGSNSILQNINWEIKEGEKWVLSGPNGSGKSTLLGLITADHPQAYAQNLWLFGRKRGTGESIWDIKKQIGFMSPEIQVYFPGRQESMKIVVSGLYESMGLYRKLLPKDQFRAEKVLEFLGILNLAKIVFSDLSTGEKRLVLLARTLIKNAPLLILDEPCQGLDETNKARFTLRVEQICQDVKQTLIYVSHYREELPASTKLEFSLPDGLVTSLNIRQLKSNFYSSADSKPFDS